MGMPVPTQTNENTPPSHPKSVAEVALWMSIRSALLGVVAAIEIYLEWKSRKKTVN